MKNAIPYTNKDILFKVLERYYKNKSLAVYGLDLPKIKRMLPTSYPSIYATEIHADNPFLLEDGSLYLQEYESTVKPQDGLKYAKYICAACDYLQKESIHISNVIVGIIYTGDIESAPDTYDFGALRVQVKQVFLSKFDSDAMRVDLINKVEQSGSLSDEDMLRLIILPLTQPCKEKKQDLVKEAVEIAKKITDESRQMFGISGIMVAADKFIDKAYSNKIKEWLSMTQLARLYEEEKIEAVNIAQRNSLQQGLQQAQVQIAQNMLMSGMDSIQILQLTGLTRSELEQLRLSIIETQEQTVNSTDDND